MYFTIGLLLAIAYIIWAGIMATNAIYEIMTSKRVDDGLQRYYKAEQANALFAPLLEIAGGIGVILLFLVLFALAPITWVGLKWHKSAEAERKQREADRTHAENRLRRDMDNARRNEERVAWLARNPVELFYNTSQGITAVVTPESYQQASKKTEVDRYDERWEHACLQMIRPTFIFVTKEGWNLIALATGDNHEVGQNPFISGWRSELRSLEQRCVKLVKKDDIFVPFVNGTVYPVDEQARMLTRQGVSLIEDTVIPYMVPQELQPLPVM